MTTLSKLRDQTDQQNKELLVYWILLFEQTVETKWKKEKRWINNWILTQKYQNELKYQPKKALNCSKKRKIVNLERSEADHIKSIEMKEKN